MKSASGRTIQWVPLKPLSWEDALSLFPNSQKYPQLQRCISDCNGHPRSLEALKILCDKKGWQLPEYLPLVQEFIYKLESSAIPIPEPSHIIAALRGQSVHLEDSPDLPVVGKKSTTYREYVAQGHFLNTLEDGEAKIIPQLSPILLMLFATNHAHYADGDDIGEIARSIRDLLHSETNFYWQVTNYVIELVLTRCITCIKSFMHIGKLLYDSLILASI